MYYVVYYINRARKSNVQLCNTNPAASRRGPEGPSGNASTITVLTSFIEQERKRCKVPTAATTSSHGPGPGERGHPSPSVCMTRSRRRAWTHERVKKTGKACTSPRRLCVLPLRANRWRCQRANYPDFHRDVCCRAAPVVYGKRMRAKLPPFCVS